MHDVRTATATGAGSNAWHRVDALVRPGRLAARVLPCRAACVRKLFLAGHPRQSGWRRGRVGGRGGLQPPSTAAEVRVHTPTRVSLEEILPGY